MAALLREILANPKSAPVQGGQVALVVVIGWFNIVPRTDVCVATLTAKMSIMIISLAFLPLVYGDFSSSASLKYERRRQRVKTATCSPLTSARFVCLFICLLSTFEY